MKIGGDFSKLSALEARYHNDCHALYMKNKRSSSGGMSPYDEAFDRFVDYLMPLLYNGRAIEMSNLLDKYKEFFSEIESEDDINPNSYHTECLKAWMQKYFGQTIAFADQKRKTPSQIVYSSSIDMKDVINIASNYKEALNDLKVIGEVEDIQNYPGLDSYDRVLFYAGSVVKAEIKNVTGINTAPLSPDNISLAKAKEIIPKCFISLLSWICGTSDFKEQKVLAIAQDIITVASSGKKMLPKHVGLAISLKNNLRSKELYNLLNKNGHCISYDEVSLPSNIQSSNGCLVQAIADNGDYGQEENSRHINKFWKSHHHLQNETFLIQAS